MYFLLFTTIVTSTSSEPLILYGLDISNFCSSVKIALNHKRLDYVQVEPPGGYGSYTYKKINSMGTIPALALPSGLLVSESQVILEFLEQQYPIPSLMFTDAAQNSKLRLVHRIHDLYLEPSVRCLFSHMDPCKRDMTFVGEKFAMFNERLKLIESLLHPDGPFVFGKQFTIADCFLPPTLLMAHCMAQELYRRVDFSADPYLTSTNSLLGLQDYPKLQSWYDCVRNHQDVSPVLNSALTATLEWIERKKGGAKSTCSL